MSAILSLKANVTRDEAIVRLRGVGVPRLFRSWFVGPLRAVADVYVPFRLYRVVTRNRGASRTQLLALDVVRGAFDLYGFDHVPGSDELVELQTSNHPPPALDEAQAGAMMIERVRRLVFGGGFFRIRKLEIEAEPAGLDFHVPYWVGFSGRGEKANLAVLDAVRRRPEGGKVRTFIREWLAGSAGSAGN